MFDMEDDEVASDFAWGIVIFFAIRRS